MYNKCMYKNSITEYLSSNLLHAKTYKIKHKQIPQISLIPLNIQYIVISVITDLSAVTRQEQYNFIIYVKIVCSMMTLCTDKQILIFHIYDNMKTIEYIKYINNIYISMIYIRQYNFKIAYELYDYYFFFYQNTILIAGTYK